jgi:hypothetical protein
MPKPSAFWRKAPMVRFISLEIFATGVFERECAFNSRTSSLVHSRRTTRFFAVLAIGCLSNEYDLSSTQLDLARECLAYKPVG